MKKKAILKLTLNRETLRELTSVQGGQIDGEQIETCYNSCPSVCACGNA